jgi:hypothetical protein
MAEVLCYIRNNCTSVVRPDDETLVASCRIQDTLMELFVQITVKLPHLEIVEAEGEILRSLLQEEVDVKSVLQRSVGVRVGPGIKKIVKGLMGHSRTEQNLVYMIGECCNGVILSFTRDVLRLAPRDPEKEKAFFAGMVKDNPRLYNSCAALAPGSPLMEGVNIS